MEIKISILISVVIEIFLTLKHFSDFHKAGLRQKSFVKATSVSYVTFLYQFNRHVGISLTKRSLSLKPGVLEPDDSTEMHSNRQTLNQKVPGDFKLDGYSSIY